MQTPPSSFARRRWVLAALACWPAAHLLAQEEAAAPRHKLSAAQLHAALSARFPVRVVAAGLIALQVSAPNLLLLPARNQLGATLVLQLDGAQWQQVPPGEVDVVFSLRYEPTDRSLRAHRLDILALRWQRLQPDILLLLQAQLRAAVREAVGEVVLHKFAPRELALAEAMGLEPQRLTVVDDGVVVSFGAKPPR
ncbi:DUF1439 domain-containing protein [Caenimonas aquaedulcis]|uniref:DUF1439 domain-containing protein n=1 Tax=Caenimonas aquaedulcis TaxID=2793270 RepID=A0A931H8P8_9BURK|nr:DUF1439 domain-containing protein [Caenimonas aquaedulcis]MBG9390447.1 DUF1439 domain-containing protein [Caenimonas aquaedulcis]